MRAIILNFCKILTSKQRYADEDEYLTKKIREITSKARRILRNPVETQNVSQLIEGLSTYADVLEIYPEDRKKLG